MIGSIVWKIWKTWNWNKKKSVKEDRFPRLMILYTVFTLLCLILLRRLWILQIVDGVSYAENFELKITRTITEKGAGKHIRLQRQYPRVKPAGIHDHDGG